MKIKYRFDGKMVELAQSSRYRHVSIIHLASYLGQPLTTGSWSTLYPTGRHAKTEMMSLETGEWITEADYPFAPM